MGRRKLPLQLIPNEKARKISYEKRKKSIMKKAQEFNTLCAVDTCMIIYGPAGSAATTSTEPEVWPESPEKVKRIIERYMSEGADRLARRKVGLPQFFMNRNKKVDAELAKSRLRNWKANYPISKQLTKGPSREDVRRIVTSLGHKFEAAKARVAMRKEHAMRRSSNMCDHDVLEMTLSETSSYGLIMDNLSPEDTPSCGVYCDASMAQPILPLGAALFDARDLLRTQMMQASSQRDFQFLDHQLSF